MLIELATPKTKPEVLSVNSARVLFKGNIMDLGLSAGEAAVALKNDFQAETLGTAMAEKFLLKVQKAFKWTSPDSPQEHQRYLMDAEALLELLSIEIGAAVSEEARRAVGMFRHRVEDGRQLLTKIPESQRDSFPVTEPEERA
jgi:hypothetical protein